MNPIESHRVRLEVIVKVKSTYYLLKRALLSEGAAFVGGSHQDRGVYLDRCFEIEPCLGFQMPIERINETGANIKVIASQRGQYWRRTIFGNLPKVRIEVHLGDNCRGAVYKERKTFFNFQDIARQILEEVRFKEKMLEKMAAMEEKR